MALSDAQLDRYARQIIIPEIGARGQETLLASRVWLLGHPCGVSMARRYLSAGGVTTLEGQHAAGADCVFVAQPSQVDAAALARVIACGRPVVWYELTTDGYRSGVRRASEPIGTSHAEPGGRGEDTALRHAVAACDAAGSVVAVLLGFQLPDGVYEARFA